MKLQSQIIVEKVCILIHIYAGAKLDTWLFENLLLKIAVVSIEILRHFILPFLLDIYFILFFIMGLSIYARILSETTRSSAFVVCPFKSA